MVRSEIEDNSYNFYSAWDLQTREYIHSGRNSRTRQECVVALAEYLNSDREGDEDDPFCEETEEAVCVHEFEIHGHEDRIEEEDYEG